MTATLSDEQINEIRLAFDLLDAEGHGTISTSNMKIAIRSLGQSPSEAEMAKITRDVDSKGGQVNQQMFIQIMSGIIGQADSEEDLIAAFATFDKYNEGTISVDDFRHVMSHLGDPLPSREIEQLLQVGGVVGDRLDYQAWIQAMLA